MKLRHIAALALVGWYLMTPPSQLGQMPNVDVPLSQWTQLDTYDTSTSCKKGLESQLLLAKRSIAEVQSELSSLLDTGDEPMSEVAPEVYEHQVEVTAFALAI